MAWSKYCPKGHISTTTPAEVITGIRSLKAINQLGEVISELNSSHTVLEFFPHIPVTYLIAAWNKVSFQN